MELKLHDSSENRRMKAIRKSLSGVLCLVLFSGSGIAAAQPLVLNETPAGDGEWGYHPADGSVSQVNPPSFSWRPQENLRWELECSHDSTLGVITYSAHDIEFNVHCPPHTLAQGTYTWRYRGKDADGRFTNWSSPRTFTIAQDAAVMPLPQREELIARIPAAHPRLFVRPENIDTLRT